jgi:flagellar hook-basal body complex protein FliE
MKIQDVTGAVGAGELAPAPGRVDGGAKGAAFGDVLKQSLSEVNRLQEKADAAITALASGEKASLHDTMIAMEQASISFKLMMQVRNKIVEAYQEMMRIQV